MSRSVRTALLVALFAFAAWSAWYAWSDGSVRKPAEGAVRPVLDGAASARDDQPAAHLAAPPTGAGDPTPTSSPVVARESLAPPPAFVLRGRTVRARDVPLPNAPIRVRAFHGTSAVGEPFVEELLTSDDDAQFAWALAPLTEVTHLELRGVGEKVGNPPKTFTFAPGDPAPEPFDLWIVRYDGVVRGRVLDSKGAPIAGAVVQRSSSTKSAPTDSEGHYEVNVPWGHSSLKASAPSFVTGREDIELEAAQGTLDLDFRLRDAICIHGTVRDEPGNPIAGATVRTFHTIYDRGDETDSDGRYLLDNLDPSLGEHSLFARREGYVEGKAQVTAKGRMTEQDLVLARGVAVRGVVVDASTGAAVPKAQLFLGFSPNAYDRIDATSDADGGFEFPCVARGEHTLNAECTGFAGQRQQIEVPAAPARPVVVRVSLERGHYIGGVVVDGAGEPVTGVGVSARLDRQYLDGVRGRTDEAGRFRLDGLPAMGLDLEFYGNGILRHDEPVPSVDRDDLRVVVERHGFIAGTVVDGRTRAPIPRFRIRFGTPRLQEGAEQASGFSVLWIRGGKAFDSEDGTFRIDEEMRVGSVMALEASAEGYGPTVIDPVTVVAVADPSALIFRMWPGTTIEGRVVAADTRAPLEGVRLVAYTPSRPPQPSEPNDAAGRPIAHSAADGSFRLENVGAGEVRIRAELADCLPVVHGPITVEPGREVAPQEVQMHRGVTLTIAARTREGGPMGGALVTLHPDRGVPGGQRSGTADLAGEVRFEVLAPGTYSARLQAADAPRGPTRMLCLEVDADDSRVVLSERAGDAALRVVVESETPLPSDVRESLRLTIMALERAPQAGFRSHSEPLVAAPDGIESLVSDLPEAKLQVTVEGWRAAAAYRGFATVTPVAGQVTEVRVRVSPSEPR